MSIPENFKTAIGVKLIEYAPMDVLTFSKTYGRAIKSTEVDGYVVRYPDGYISWSPKSTFDSAYFPIQKSDSLTSEDIEDFVNFEGGDYKAMTKTTVQQAVSVTGFEYIGTSPCVKPENYKHDIGIGYACDAIREKVWEHLGFVLQWAINGIKPKATIGKIPENSTFKDLVMEEVDLEPTPEVPERIWVAGTPDEPGHWEEQ